MKLYKVNVCIEETVSKDFLVNVQADNMAEAFDKAKSIAENKYSIGEFVLDPGELTDVKINPSLCSFVGDKEYIKLKDLESLVLK